jgi:hypothetical protein
MGALPEIAEVRTTLVVHGGEIAEVHASLSTLHDGITAFLARRPER